MKEYFKWIGACVFAFFWMALISPTFADWLAGTPLNAPTADGQINESGALITSISTVSLLNRSMELIGKDR